MARSLPKVCPFLVTDDLKLKWPELPRPIPYTYMNFEFEIELQSCALLIEGFTTMVHS